MPPAILPKGTIAVTLWSRHAPNCAEVFQQVGQGQQIQHSHLKRKEKSGETSSLVSALSCPTDLSVSCSHLFTQRTVKQKRTVSTSFLLLLVRHLLLVARHLFLVASLFLSKKD